MSQCNESDVPPHLHLLVPADLGNVLIDADLGAPLIQEDRGGESLFPAIIVTAVSAATTVVVADITKQSARAIATAVRKWRHSLHTDDEMHLSIQKGNELSVPEIRLEPEIDVEQLTVIILSAALPNDRDWTAE
jgi:hypothetical protein